MDIKRRFFLIVVILIGLFECSLPLAALQDDQNKVRVVYISDLNLYNTPIQNQPEKHPLEKESGILVYESQAVFQEIIRYLNQKLLPDVVIFAGNNIADAKKSDNLWQLFLDVVSELKSEILINFGVNELRLYNTDELINSLRAFDRAGNTSWHFEKIKNYLFIGLDSVSLFNNSKISKEQLKWLESILSKNKNLTTVVTLYHPLLDANGVVLNTPVVKKIVEIINENPQIKLVLFGGQYFNRTYLLNGCLFVSAPSPVVYPCSFKYIELLPKAIKVKTITIPLKGIVNKALKSAESADVFKTQIPSKDLKSYLSGSRQDLQFDHVFKE